MGPAPGTPARHTISPRTDFHFKRLRGNFLECFICSRPWRQLGGSLGHSGTCRGTSKPACRGARARTGVVRPRVARRAGVSWCEHNKRPLKASPTGRAGSVSRANRLAGPLLEGLPFKAQRWGSRTAHVGEAQPLPHYPRGSRWMSARVRAGPAHIVLPRQGPQ